MGITCGVKYIMLPELIDIQKKARYGDHKMRDSHYKQVG